MFNYEPECTQARGQVYINTAIILFFTFIV